MLTISKLLLSFVIAASILACNNPTPPPTVKNDLNADSLAIQQGKTWLIENIESFFNNDEIFMKGFSSLCTTQYAEFKSDATNVDNDGGLTEEEFKVKWGRRYSEFAGIGVGFMISAQDFGKIEVEKCEFENMSEMKQLKYNVVIIDKTNNVNFHRKVVLTKNGTSFLIDDVQEMPN